MGTMKKTLLLLLVVVMMLSVTTVQAQAKTYKANKVTAKQIVTQLNKTGLIKKMIKPDAAMDPRTPNLYKSKYNFIDKKYNDVYCTVEVFRDNLDAVRRQASIDALYYLYDALEIEEDVPLHAYRYKNVVLRVGRQMKLERVLKYFNALKKMIR